MDLGDGRRFSQTTPWASLRAARPRGAANQIDVSVIYVPNVQFSKIAVNVSTLDSNGSDFYQWAITDTSGNVKCSITKVNLTGRRHERSILQPGNRHAQWWESHQEIVPGTACRAPTKSINPG